MSVAYDMKTKKGIIKYVLKNFPESRDCDLKLTAHLWDLECKMKKYDQKLFCYK